MNNTVEENLPNNGIIEEGFEQDPKNPSRFVLKTKPSMSIPGITMLVGMLLLSAIILQQTGWQVPTGKHLGVILFFFILTIATFAISGLPQRLYMERGAANGTLLLGYGRAAFRCAVRFDSIKGLALSTTMLKRVGRVPQLNLVWKDMAFPLSIGTYLENDIALERAKYISEQTGIPIARVAMDPVIRRRKA